MRLFKTTFENPQPADEIRGIELLSLFARASSAILAITLEEPATPDPAAVQSVEETEDIDLRREVLVRTLDSLTGKAMSNVVVSLTVTEEGRTYGFGSYKSDLHGQILVDYPPGKFRNLRLSVNQSDLMPYNYSTSNSDGIFRPEILLRLRRRTTTPIVVQ